MAGRDLSKELFGDTQPVGRDLSAELFGDSRLPEEKKSLVDIFLANLGRGAGQGATPEEVKQSGQEYLNYSGGTLQGAANIGSTIINPIDSKARNARKQAVKEGIQSIGAQADSSLYGAGELTTEIAGTAGLPGAIAKPFIYGGQFLPGLTKIGNAIASGGFNVAPASTLIGKLSNAGLRVGGGAVAGGSTAGLIEPDNAETGAAWGAGIGSVSPIIMNTVGKIVQKYSRPTQAEIPNLVNSATDNALNQVSKDLGVNVKDLPDDTVKLVRSEVEKAMTQGKIIDPAAMMRQKEFEKLGIKPLTGQITRDPTQFAQERNLRGVSPDIAGRIQQQNITLQSIFGKPAAEAAPSYEAGNQLSDALSKYQAGQKANISGLYDAARADTGRYANVDVASFTSAVNKNINDQMLGRFVPENVKGLLVDIGNGKIPLNVNNLVQVDSVLSHAQRNADAAGQKAIGVIRDSLNSASIESGSGEAAKQAFDIARKAARANFAQQDAIPALKAVAEGNAVPDTFVKQFLTSGKTDEVKKLAELLKSQSPKAFAQAKAQVADDIRRAAFGENMAGDAPVSPERLAKKLRDLGYEKMRAFFTPEEIANYQTASRVAAYIGKHPNAAPVNTSNTLVAQLMTNPTVKLASNGIQAFPGLSLPIAAGKAMSSAVNNQMAISQAMNAKVPMKAMELSESHRRLLEKVLGTSSAEIASQLAQ